MWATSIGSTFAHRPVSGVRKSGMPDGTEIPAPVSTTAGPAVRISSASRSRSLTAPPVECPKPDPRSLARGAPGSWSRPLEVRRALVDERRDALAAVLGAVDAQECVALGRQAGVEVCVVGDALDLLDRERRLAGEPAAPRQRGVEQLVVLQDAVHEPVLEGLLGRDRVAEGVHLERLGGPDQP